MADKGHPDRGHSDRGHPDRGNPEVGQSDMASAMRGLPRDARAAVMILESMGLRDFEPRVVTQLLEFSHRYIVDVLGDAKAYSEHAGKALVDVDDVTLAIQSRVNVSFTQPPPRELMMEIARARNLIPLPMIETTAGIPLPPESECLTQPNFQWATTSVKAAQQQEQEQRTQHRMENSKGTNDTGSRKRGADTVERQDEDGMEWEPSGANPKGNAHGVNGPKEPTLLPTEKRSSVSFAVGRRK